MNVDLCAVAIITLLIVMKNGYVTSDIVGIWRLEMTRFFHSIFGSPTTTESNYPESLIKAAIEHAVDGTDPWIRAVSGYRKKLRPAVERAIDYVVALVDGMEPPIEMGPDIFDEDPQLHTFFISTTDMRKIVKNDLNLAHFLSEKNGSLSSVYALLVMEKQEKVILGAELSGEIIQYGVPHTVVSFEGHRLIDPTESKDETLHQLKRRVFNHLLILALRRITIVKTEHEKLERYRALLQSKLNLLHRSGWGFDKTAADEQLDVYDIENLLERIETNLLELGGDDNMIEVYLEIVIDVLNQPEENLWFRKETSIIDHMGIKRSKTASDTREAIFNVICNSEGHNFVVSLVSLSGDMIQKITH